jgi:hypothetical protein
MQQPNMGTANSELREMYSRFGWKWVALAYTAGRVIEEGGNLPARFAGDLGLARTRLESGCYSLCDIMCELRNLEARLFPSVLKLGEGPVHDMLELLSKAMNGNLHEEDLEMPSLKLVVSDCAIPTCCKECKTP